MDVTEDRTSDLTVERGPACHRVRLERPDRGNVLSPQLIEALGAALSECERDPDARALVIEGRDGVFCDGMDLTAAAESSRVRHAGGEAFVRLLDRFTTADVVVISVVDGRVLGGGVGIVAASDFVFASPRSTFCMPEALWGLVPCLVAPFVVRRAGLRLCQRMALSTMSIDADTALAGGLVDVVEQDPATGSSAALLNRLRRVQPGSSGAAKRYLSTLRPVDEETIDRALDTLEQLLGSPAMVQRLRGFADHQQLPWELPDRAPLTRTAPGTGERDG